MDLSLVQEDVDKPKNKANALKHCDQERRLYTAKMLVLTSRRLLEQLEKSERMILMKILGPIYMLKDSRNRSRMMNYKRNQKRFLIGKKEMSPIL